MGLLNCSTGPFGIYDCDDHTEEVGVACNPASKLLISLCEIIEDPYTHINTKKMCTLTTYVGMQLKRDTFSLYNTLPCYYSKLPLYSIHPL